VSQHQYRINQEIKFLYTTKIKLNEQLFKRHLKCADKWQSIWPIIIQSIDCKLTKEMETHYNNLNRKLDKLQREKTNQEKNGHPPPTHTILHQDVQPNKHKTLSRRISVT
jgi:hypothetical protein